MVFSTLKKRIGITLDDTVLDAVDQEKSLVGRSRSNYINHILKTVLIANIDGAGDDVRKENEDEV